MTCVKNQSSFVKLHISFTAKEIKVLNNPHDLLVMFRQLSLLVNNANVAQKPVKLKNKQN
jgi:hypothetical protein